MVRRTRTAIVQQAAAQTGRLPTGYAALLAELKRRIRAARLRAALSVNRELTTLYWRIGRDILTRQTREGWGTKVIDRLSADLRRAFPEMTGFSPRNLKYMRAVAEAWDSEPFVQQVVAQIPWGHVVRILDRVKNPRHRQWYIGQTVRHGWSRNVLVHQIESGLHRRLGKATTNFDRTLPPPQSDLANETLKDPYSFDFLAIGKDAHERDLERGLLDHVRDFLLELGVGFAFVGSQVNLEVGGEDFYLDLLFYHLRLRCFVVVDLKTGEFKPEYAGKMNFYLSAVDDLMRRPDDRPSIGLILCKERSRVVVEYALRDTAKPIGVSAYRLAQHLPGKLKGRLPTVDELKMELSGEDDRTD